MRELPWKGLRKGLKEGFEAFDGGQRELQRPEKQMAGELPWKGLREGLVVGVAAARLRPLKLGKPLKHRQAIVAGM